MCGKVEKNEAPYVCMCTKSRHCAKMKPESPWMDRFESIAKVSAHHLCQSVDIPFSPLCRATALEVYKMSCCRIRDIMEGSFLLVTIIEEGGAVSVSFGRAIGGSL